jgi:leader peptidase (prepilin peptidase) / N-methyltransferase
MLSIAVTDFRRYTIPNDLMAVALALALVRAGMVGPEAGCGALVWAAG